MAVYKRKTTAGESKFYNYRFKINGKIYYGVCYTKDNNKIKATTKPYAEAWEKYIKLKVGELAKQKSIKALVENFREEMTGGNAILLSEAYELSLKKPNKRQASKSLIKVKQSYWLDFVKYIQQYYPDVKKLADVKKKHAEEYIQYIRKNGRFDKEVLYSSGKNIVKFKRNWKLSNKTCNTFQQTLSEVFRKLRYDAGLIENPFDGIYKLDNEAESREAFTEKELELIKDKADDFIRPLFCIGIATALREGDICTLKWDDIDLKNNIIRKKMSKTRRFVEIPILPPLRTFLLEQKQISQDNPYVLPTHAEMYLKNPTGINWRVRTFLEGIGIKTTKKVENRDRQISIKGVHSLRHTFCYYAGVYGIPLLVVKDIVGHVSPQMTELYQRHADNRLKREKLMQMPDFMGLSNSSEVKTISGSEPERAQLMELVQTADIQKIKKTLKTFL